MLVCCGGSLASLRANEVWDNCKQGIMLRHNTKIVVAQNSVHHNDQIGISVSNSGGWLECNSLWGHADSAIHLCSGSDTYIASNRIHGGRMGITTCEGAKGRVQGNSFWNNSVGVDLAAGVHLSMTGNRFSGNACGIGSDLAPSPGTFGPGNVFAFNAAADYFERSSSGEEGGEAMPVPSDVVSCAHCSAVVALGKPRCGGCARFGATYAPCYCGAACQKAHWPAHRAECKRAEERGRAREAAFEAAADALLVFESCGYGCDAYDSSRAPLEVGADGAEAPPGPASTRECSHQGHSESH